MILPYSIRFRARCQRKGLSRGWTVMELLVALGIGMLVLAAMAATSVFCLRSFAGIYNYTDLDATSRNALDSMSREIREATAVVASSPTEITLVNTSVSPAITNSYTWNADETVTWDKTGQETITMLTGCNSWTNALLQGWPDKNYAFPLAATTPDQCKIVALKWKCSRTIFGIKVNSETEQAAEIVLRNKQ